VKSAQEAKALAEEVLAAQAADLDALPEDILLEDALAAAPEEHLVIPPEYRGQRLDAALAALLPAYSRSRLKGWLEAGRIAVDGQPARPRTKIMGGEAIRLSPDFPAITEWLPEALPLEIVHEDPDLLVVIKPAGLTVHPGAGQPSGTLVNALLHYDPALAALPRAGLVHRLDKDTSGLLVVARSPRAHAALVAALAAREVKRRYLAVVQGVPIVGGRIEAPLGRHPRDRLRMAVVGGGRPSVTHYRVRARYRVQAALEVDLESGRTHQIRVHLAHVGFPVVGDPLYGRRPRLPPAPLPALAATLAGFSRQALHAEHLSFAHPVTGAELGFHAPPPPDLLELLRLLAEDCARAAGS
jgi:23S rRNA pseudouridine1911/1915/1917 synthase